MGVSVDTEVNIPELYKKYNVKESKTNKFIEEYVDEREKALEINTKTFKMRNISLDMY